MGIGDNQAWDHERPTQLRHDLYMLDLGWVPDGQALEDAPLIEHWKLIERQGGVALAGFVAGHPTIREGDTVRTSALMAIDEQLRWARTINRFYRLGAPAFAGPLPKQELDEWFALVRREILGEGNANA